jgi:hypothetical protein
MHQPIKEEMNSHIGGNSGMTGGNENGRGHC